MTVGAPQTLQPSPSGMLVWVEKWLSFHVTYHGQIKPGGAQPSPSLVWVRSFYLLDELLDESARTCYPAGNSVPQANLACSR